MDNTSSSLNVLDSFSPFGDSIVECVEFNINEQGETLAFESKKDNVNKCSNDMQKSNWCDQTVFSDKEVKELDREFLNGAFTQLSFLNDDDDAFKDSSLEKILQAHDDSMLQVDGNDFESTNTVQKEDPNILKECIPHKEDAALEQVDEFLPSICFKSQDVRNCHSPKRQLPMLNNVEPKKLCTTNVKNTVTLNSENEASFYGLPIVVKKLIQKIKGISTLYQWQDECLKLRAIVDRKNLVYALPTSGGKTLVAEILMLREILVNKKNAIFILPYVSLVQEKVQSLAPFALELNFLIEEYAGPKGQYPPKKRRKKKSIYICTIEKALGLVNSLIETDRLEEVGITVVDELHLLGESGGRGATLEVLLTKVMFANENLHIVGMSATIGNLNEIVKFLKADLYTQNFRPIEIKEYVKCGNEIWLLNLKEEEILTDAKKINYRYSREANILDPDRIGGLVMDVVPKDSCLVFCCSRKNSENVALLLTKILPRSLEEHKTSEKLTLLNALKMEEGLCPILAKTIPFGIAYHHSGLTIQERRLLEDGFMQGTLCAICCTSTLAAGINLPARRVILRSPYVGREFLSLGRYKQMVGRAGRAGLGDVGESIIICKSNELQQVKDMLTSKMDDSVSSLHEQKDRGINSLILSAIFLSLAASRSKLRTLVSTTLMNIQKQSLNIDIKKLTDETIGVMLKSGIVKVKNNNVFNVMRPNITICVPSQYSSLPINKTPSPAHSKVKKTVILTDETELELCDLGRAAIKAGIDLQYAYVLYDDLKTTQKHLVLLDCLHLLYLVTPYDLSDNVKPVGSIYYDEITNLSETQMVTARLLGINEAIARKIRDDVTPKNVNARVLNRFYVTLILNELWNQRAVYVVAEKFKIDRGIVQNFLNAVSTFSGSVVRFCQELDEFWSFRDILSSFSKKLFYCCPAELEVLMELPAVKAGRARQLYKAGYKTIKDIAKADPFDLKDKLQYLSMKTIEQIIAAANLLLIEKVEDLREEAEDVLGGVNLSQFT